MTRTDACDPPAPNGPRPPPGRRAVGLRALRGGYSRQEGVTMTSNARLDRVETINRRRKAAGLDPIALPGATPMKRVGALPSTSRIRQVIEHNRGLRQRLIADIEAAAERAGLNGGRLAALVQHMTGERSCSELTLWQLRLVVDELRNQASRHRAGHRPGDSSAGTAAAGGWGAPAATPSPSSTPKGDIA